MSTWQTVFSVIILLIAFGVWYHAQLMGIKEDKKMGTDYWGVQNAKEEKKRKKDGKK